MSKLNGILVNLNSEQLIKIALNKTHKPAVSMSTTRQCDIISSCVTKNYQAANISLQLWQLWNCPEATEHSAHNVHVLILTFHPSSHLDVLGSIKKAGTQLHCQKNHLMDLLLKAKKTKQIYANFHDFRSQLEVAQRVHISAKWILYETTDLKDIRITTLNSEGHVTSLITWPFYTTHAISYRCPVVAESLSRAVFKISK